MVMVVSRHGNAVNVVMVTVSTVMNMHVLSVAASDAG